MIEDSLPSNYKEQFEDVECNIYRYLKNEEWKSLDSWLHKHVYNLPTIYGWKRKDIYFLIRNLLNYSFSLTESEVEELNTILYDIETGIIGNCSPTSIIAYRGEPDDIEELTRYVRDFNWLAS